MRFDDDIETKSEERGKIVRQHGFKLGGRISRKSGPTTSNHAVG